MTKTKSSSKRYRGVRELKKGVYEINFRPYRKAERIFKTIKAVSLQEAYGIKTHLLSQYADEHNIKSKTIDGGIDFGYLRERLEGDFKGDKARKKTISRAMNTFNTFFFGFLPKEYPQVKQLNDLSLDVFNAYKNYIVNDLSRENGWRSELGTLKGLFSRFVKLGFCKKQIRELMEELKKPQQPQKQYIKITKIEKRKLLNAIKKDRKDYYGVTYLLMRLGWRIGETLSIKKSDIKMKGLEPVSILLRGENRKNSKEFALNIIDEGLATVIKSFRLVDTNSEYLFSNYAGNKVSDNKYRDYLARVSIKVISKRLYPHAFRHSLITESLLKGVSIRDIMAITGHLDIDTILKCYSHSTVEGQERVLKVSEI